MRSFLVLGMALVLAFPATSLRLDPSPEAQDNPASGPALTQDRLITLALAFSTVTPDDRPKYTEVLTRWVAEFQAQDGGQDDQGHRAEALLLFLHTHLKAYSTYQTRLDVLIDQGRYNCVSSALAYMILGRAVGLDVQAVATPDHAFALVRLPQGNQVDVETTTKFGYDPGTKTAFTNSFGQTGFVYVPPGNYAQRKTIGDRGLLGLLLQNRMADDERTGRDEEGVGLGIDRWVTEGSPEAFQTLVDGFTHYVARLNDQRAFETGLSLVERMVTWTGTIPVTQQLAFTLVNNGVNERLGRRDWSGAQTLVQTWKEKALLTDAQASELQRTVANQKLNDEVETLGPDQAVPAIEEARAQGVIDPSRRQELLSVAYGRQAEALAGTQGPWAAFTYLQTLPPEVQQFSMVDRGKKVYEHNWVSAVHNHFAQLWNSGQRAEARQVLEQALTQDPGAALLQNDLSRIQGH